MGQFDTSNDLLNPTKGYRVPLGPTRRRSTAGAVCRGRCVAKKRATPAPALTLTQAEEDAIALIVSGGEHRAGPPSNCSPAAKARQTRNSRPPKILWQGMLRLRYE